MRRASLFLVAFLGLGSLSGCEMISQLQGVAALAEQLGEHLDADLKAPLTDEHIDMFVRVTPELKAFTEEAEVKWKPDPDANDFKQLSTQLGALSDYIAFFESQDTRLTQFYVVTIKIYDAYALIGFEEGQIEARKRLDTERAELEAKKAAASGDEAAKLDKELERNKLALENLDKLSEARRHGPDEQHQRPYTLTEEEIALVKARQDEIKAALEDAGYETAKDDEG